MNFIKSLKLIIILSVSIVGTATAQGINNLTSTNTYCCFKKAPTLDTEQFGKAIHHALKQTGYVMQIQKNGKTIHSQYWGWARTRLDGNMGWSPDVPMHVASVSKLITAIGLKKLLLVKGISLDAKIIDYLPGSWEKGSNIGQITFRHLMTHTSGFANIGSTTNYSHMKNAVAQGVPVTGMYDYENVNFSLCRILTIFILYGKEIDLNFNWTDQHIDGYSSYYYNKYMQDYVFKPSGVYGATTKSSPSHALAYPSYVAGLWGSQPWNPSYSGGGDQGDLTKTVGGIGWSMSVNDLLKLMHSFRQSGNIMSNNEAQKLLDDRLGIDVKEITIAGTYYHKNGAWGPLK